MPFLMSQSSPFVRQLCILHPSVMWAQEGGKVRTTPSENRSTVVRRPEGQKRRLRDRKRSEK